MRTVSTAGVVTEQLSVSGLPVRVQEALGELAGAAKEGLLALSVGVGLGVLHEIMEAEVDEVVGPKGKHDRDRTAKRHGHEDGSVTLGGRRVAVRRPRVRSADDEHELALQTYRHFADRDPLTQDAERLARAAFIAECKAREAAAQRDLERLDALSDEDFDEDAETARALQALDADVRLGARCAVVARRERAASPAPRGARGHRGCPTARPARPRGPAGPFPSARRGRAPRAADGPDR